MFAGLLPDQAGQAGLVHDDIPHSCTTVVGGDTQQHRYSFSTTTPEHFTTTDIKTHKDTPKAEHFLISVARV